MAKKELFLDTITDQDIEDIGLKVLQNNEAGRYIQDGETSFIQIGDKDGILDDGTFTCHYEIIHIVGNKKKYQHINDRIYVEIHFEHPTFSRHFKDIVENLTNDNNELIALPWERYCPSIRLTENGFTTNQKNEILTNLQKLKNITLKTILDNYQNCFSDKETEWKSEFNFNSNHSNNNSGTRRLSSFTRDPQEIEVTHERIKNSLIQKLKNNTDPIHNQLRVNIAINSVKTEHPVNKINYIDVVAKISQRNEYIFFEIKTATSARLCIRQALGQLMEYAYYPNVNHAQKLFVVGTGKKDKNVENYIENLNKNFKINIDYLQIEL